jgi:hypothetical protein
LDLRLRLTLAAYEAVRSEPTQFVVALGHELPEIQVVISRGDGYQLVRKQGDAADLVAQKDPRS